MNLSIRQATPADLPALNENPFHLLPGAIARKVRDEEVFTAEVDGKVVGGLLYEYVWTRFPLVSFIWVNPDHRRKGIAVKMLEHLEDLLRNQSYPLLLSSTQIDNRDGYGWHRGAGFEECGIIAGMNQGGLGEVFFRKDLQALS